MIQDVPNSFCKGLNTFLKNYLQNCKRCLTFFYELCGIISKKKEIMKGYERATKEEINDRLRIEENCHAQIERIIHLRHLCNLNLEEAADVTNLSIFHPEPVRKRSDQMQRTKFHNDMLPLSEVPL